MASELFSMFDFPAKSEQTDDEETVITDEQLTELFPDKVLQPASDRVCQAPNGCSGADKTTFHELMYKVRPLDNRGFSHRRMFAEVMKAVGLGGLILKGYKYLQKLSKNPEFTIRVYVVRAALIRSHGIIFPLLPGDA